MLPVAPGRLSATSCSPTRSLTLLATKRPTLPDAPPGDCGMMSRIGGSGYAVAAARALVEASSAHQNAAAIPGATMLCPTLLLPLPMDMTPRYLVNEYAPDPAVEFDRAVAEKYVLYAHRLAA